MSSAILYLAIVAIWAVVLVPRWLRPRSAQPVEQPSAEPFGVPEFDEVAATQAATAPPAEPPPLPQPATAQPVAARDATARAAGAARPVAAESSGPADESAPGGAAEPLAAEPLAAPAISSPAARRADILRARRRMLATIVALTAGAVGLAETGMAASWVIVPPAVLLAGFVVLLREAAHSDAERMRAARARHAAARRAADADLARADAPASPDQRPATVAPAAEVSLGAAAPSVPADEAPTGAEIIDISARISDQVYDQYSDAAERAVGD